MYISLRLFYLKPFLWTVVVDNGQVSKFTEKQKAHHSDFT